MDDNVNYNLLLVELDNKISDLKVEYESYFMGVIKREPLALKNNVESIIRRMSTVSIKNTAQRFRYNQLTARFNSFNQYWTRIVRKIEDGTYERDRFKLALKDKTSYAGPPPVEEVKEAGSDQKNDNYIKLFNDLIDAKRFCNESIENIDYRKFRKSMAQQAETLKKKLNCEKINFQIVIDNGKTKIKVITE